MRRLQFAFAALLIVWVVAPAAAQSARAAGTVRDANGRPIRGAVVRGVNPNGHPSQITSTSDDKGRWAMIGLGSGSWEFSVEAEGYLRQNVTAPVRLAAPASLSFVLARDLGPIPGALDKGIAQQVTDANTMRDQGRLDQAIAAYQEIRSKNPTLTSINLVMGDTYRRKAAQERDPAARTALFTLAINSYTDVLKGDASNERAKAELETVRVEASTAGGTNK